MSSNLVGGQTLQPFDYDRLVSIVGIGSTLPSANHLLGSVSTYYGGPIGTATTTMAEDDLSLAYVADNLKKLAIDYPNAQWLLVKNARIVGTGNDLSSLLHEVAQRGIDSPLIIDMSAQSTARRAVYSSWSSKNLT